ncbi:60S ribosomal protein L22-2 [Camellia lanceoleosa]|uniref:60S ribosomal protein L22-2 n=1 Tax=Camellia lanceoleosa TaxID=1840588 RepID=A0ACC0H0G7_9ERIC|nr:60S ribosomal protein L22-2 [Camellia lanceoleosa]
MSRGGRAAAGGGGGGGGAKGKKKRVMFTIDCAKPMEDKITDVASLEKFVQETGGNIIENNDAVKNLVTKLRSAKAKLDLVTQTKCKFVLENRKVHILNFDFYSLSGCT